MLHTHGKSFLRSVLPITGARPFTHFAFLSRQDQAFARESIESPRTDQENIEGPQIAQEPQSVDAQDSKPVSRGLGDEGELRPQPSVRRQRTDLSLPARFAASGSEQEHHDLKTFLDYAHRVGLKESTSVFKGTHYEYTVLSALSKFQFLLQRMGKSNDRGIDLAGYWRLPEASNNPLATVKVLIQCKAGAPKPSMVRELDGMHVGAPAGWQDGQAIGLLAFTGETTAGVRSALQRSRWPAGIIQITREGGIKQLLWNEAAQEATLEGLGVTIRYDSQTEPGDSCVALTWQGKLWKSG